METQIWSLLNDVKFKGYCLGFVVEKFQKWDRNLNIFLALSSSGSVAAWAIWNTYPLIWAGIIALSQVITVVKPYFPYFKYVKELNKKCFQVDNLSIDIERLWYEYRNETIDEKVAADRYFEIKKQIAEIFTFGDETIFDITKNIENKANGRMEIYLKNNFGITINTKR
jgi:hypothetical protein